MNTGIRQRCLSLPPPILNVPGLTDWVSNLSRTDICCSIRPRPDLQMPMSSNSGSSSAASRIKCNARSPAAFRASSTRRGTRSIFVSSTAALYKYLHNWASGSRVSSVISAPRQGCHRNSRHDYSSVVIKGPSVLGSILPSKQQRSDSSEDRQSENPYR